MPHKRELDQRVAAVDPELRIDELEREVATLRAQIAHYTPLLAAAELQKQANWIGAMKSAPHV